MLVPRMQPACRRRCVIISKRLRSYKIKGVGYSIYPIQRQHVICVRPATNQVRIRSPSNDRGTRNIRRVASLTYAKPLCVLSTFRNNEVHRFKRPSFCSPRVTGYIFKEDISFLIPVSSTVPRPHGSFLVSPSAAFRHPKSVDPDFDEAKKQRLARKGIASSHIHGESAFSADEGASE